MSLLTRIESVRFDQHGGVGGRFSAVCQGDPVFGSPIWCLRFNQADSKTVRPTALSKAADSRRFVVKHFKYRVQFRDLQQVLDALTKT